MPWDALTIQLLRAHALECLSFNARKMVPHAYCICCCRRCIVGVVVGESLSLLLVELKVMLMLLIYYKRCLLNYFVDARVLDSLISYTSIIYC